MAPRTPRDDKPRINTPPRIPPGVVLSPPEREMFDWLLANIYLLNVHGAGDGALFVKCARLWCRAIADDQKIEKHGMLMRGAQNKPLPQPYLKISRDARDASGVTLVELGGSPISRARIAAPRTALAPGNAGSWDEID